MVAAIDWTLVAQVTAAALTALAAGAAWRAAKASRDAVRDHQVGALIDDLNDLHERLTTLGVVLADDPVFHVFEQNRPGLGRHLAVIDMRLPHTEKLWRTSVPDIIEDTFEEELLSTIRELAETIAWTFLLWFGITAANLLVLRAFHLDVGFTETIFVLGWSLVGSLVPTPGGAAGAFHAATATGLLFLGVRKETAAALSIVLHLVDFAPALLFGLFYVIRGDLTWAKLRAMISPDQVVKEEA